MNEPNATDTLDTDLAPRTGDALCIVDLQRDFLPGGPLPVAEADTIVPIVQRLVELFAARVLPVIASRDWHPPDHCSFQQQGGEWPVHCVAETSGAAFAAGLTLPDTAWVVPKATSSERDAYSAFENTGLDERLQQSQVQRLFVCGLATDVCVQATVQDALQSGYSVVLITDAIRAVDAAAGDGERAISVMQQRGARIANSQTIFEVAHVAPENR